MNPWLSALLGMFLGAILVVVLIEWRLDWEASRPWTNLKGPPAWERDTK